MTRRLTLVATIALAAVAVPAPAAMAAVSYTNCTSLQKSYPHGIGRANAVDKVRGGGRPVTTFKRDTSGYNRAMKVNSRLDGDRDGIACEKR